MPRKGYTPEQIINKLREAEVLIAQGSAISIVCKKIGVSDYTYYRSLQKLKASSLSEN
jgi:putative transposase